jgi:hypothetical protein
VAVLRSGVLAHLVWAAILARSRVSDWSLLDNGLLPAARNNSR